MNYEINKDTLAILPIEKTLSKVIEKNNEYLVESSVNNVMEHSCEYFGSSMSGRHAGTKKMMNVTHKAPIVVEETTKMIFFPTSSPNSENCMWISLNNILNYMPGKTKEESIIEFTNGSKIELNVSIGVLNNQILRATRLYLILSERMEKLI